MILRPGAELIRSRKPCFLRRRRLLGWYVLFMLYSKEKKDFINRQEGIQARTLCTIPSLSCRHFAQSRRFRPVLVNPSRRYIAFLQCEASRR